MKRSAGIVLYRRQGVRLEVLIAHLGGPFWKSKDARAWSIPKGEVENGEEPFAAARREFEEELGLPVPCGDLVDLGEIKQSGKLISVFAGEGDLDLDQVVPGMFVMEWPRGSGRQEKFPEVDRAAWATPAEAREKLVLGQVAVIDRLVDLLAAEGRAAGLDGESGG